MNKPNWRKLTNGHGYVVRTQAGFNQAIKDWTVGDREYLTISDYFRFPKAYPSVVYFYDFYEGYHGYNCTCTPLNEYVQNLKAQLEELEGD